MKKPNNAQDDPTEAKGTQNHVHVVGHCLSLPETSQIQTIQRKKWQANAKANTRRYQKKAMQGKAKRKNPTTNSMHAKTMKHGKLPFYMRKPGEEYGRSSRLFLPKMSGNACE